MRFFNKRQKQYLYLKAKGKCSECGDQLIEGWHGDHVTPYSKGGETTIFNGQALCETCNLKKGTTITSIESTQKMSKAIQNIIHPEVIDTLRPWQQEFYSMPYNRYINYMHNEKNPDWRAFLAHAGVGAGKTIAGYYAASLFIKGGFQVIHLSPSSDVKREWALEYKKQGGVIHDKYKFENDWRHMTHSQGKPYQGISITYQSLNKSNLNFLINVIKMSKMNVLLVCDEVHHLGNEKSWGDSVRELSQYVEFILNLTGTPYRSDNNPIPNVKYVPKSLGASLYHDNEQELVCDFSYSYAASVRDKICCPIVFVVQRKIEINGVVYNDPLQSTDNQKYYDMIQIHENGLNPSIQKIIDKADYQCNMVRSYKPDAAILVVCDNISSATNLYKQLGGDKDATLVHSILDNDDAPKQIAEFKRSKKKWLISVNMISEGVNIPRIRVTVYLSKVTTQLFFTQVTGRGVRNFDKTLVDTKGLPIYDLAYFLMFDYEPLNVIAENITKEIKHTIGEDIFQTMTENGSREYVELPPARYTDFNTHDVKYIDDGVATYKDEFLTEDAVLKCSIEMNVPLEQARHHLKIMRKYFVQDEPSKPIEYKSSSLAKLDLNEMTYPEQAELIKKEISKRIVRLAFLKNPNISKYDNRLSQIIGILRKQINTDTGCLDGVSDVFDIDILKKQLDLINRYIREIEVMAGNNVIV